MTGCIFTYCYAIIILLLGRDTYGYSSERGLYVQPSGQTTFTVEAHTVKEGSQCTTKQGKSGVCKKLPDCLPLRADILVSSGRCGFDDFTEIICCPKREINIDGRPSEIACKEFKNKIRFYIENVDGLYGSSTTSLPSQNGNMLSSILNGNTAVEGEFPYMALLGYPNKGHRVSDPIVYNCGGSLISSKYVLTAAHCLRNVNNFVPEVVRLGSVCTRSKDAQMVPVKRAIPHPKYRRSQNHHDIALLELRGEATFSTRVKPICLPTKAPQNYNATSRTAVVAIGVGATSLDGPRSDQLLKTATLTFVPASVCMEFYTSYGRRLPMGIDSTLLCAVSANTSAHSDTCQGDSGGPLVMITSTAHTLLGVTSFGRACGTSAPGIYTSVYSFIDWIESHVWPETMTS